MATAPEVDKKVFQPCPYCNKKRLSCSGSQSKIELDLRCTLYWMRCLECYEEFAFELTITKESFIVDWWPLNTAEEKVRHW